MQKKWYRILPWIALLSGILVIFLFVSVAVFKPLQSVENVENRKAVLDKLKQIRIESTDDLKSKTFFNYVERTLNGSVINTKWLITPNGKIIYAEGGMAASTPLNSTVYSLADAQSRGLIDAVEFNLDPVQKEMMYIAASIRREGEHNDVYGHLVVPLFTKSNVLVGFVGVAYTLNDSKTPIQIYVVSIALIVCFLLYWLSLPLWVYFDSRERNDKFVLWTIFVLIGNLPAYITYLITKR